MQIKLLIVILSLLVLSACQSPQVDLTHKLEVSSNKPFEIKACALYLEQLESVVEPQDVGSVAGTRVDIDVVKWAKLSLNRANISSQAPQTLRLKITLLKAYIHSVRTSMVSNVVFKVEHRGSEDSEYQEALYFRGKAVNANWVTGEGELFDTLSDAMDSAIAKLKLHYTKSCYS